MEEVTYGQAKIFVAVNNPVLECESSTFAFQRSADTGESRTFALQPAQNYLQ